MEDIVEPTKRTRVKSKFVIILVVILLIFSGYGVAYYFYNQYKATKIVLDNPETASKNEVKEITDILAKIYDLPKDEEPSIATVLDVEKLKNQPFFARAQNGDKVVIYIKSQLAILFRVNDNKIINVSPVSMPEPTIEPEVVKTAQPKATEKPSEFTE